MSNLFKYTKRVLTSVLAAAVVLTAIPSSAFGAEMPDAEPEVVEVQDDFAEAAEVEEDASTVDGTAGEDEPVVIEEEENEPDTSSEDFTYGIVAGASTKFGTYTLSGDTATTVGAYTTITTDPSVVTNAKTGDSVNGVEFYVIPMNGYQLKDADQADGIKIEGSYKANDDTANADAVSIPTSDYSITKVNLGTTSISGTHDCSIAWKVTIKPGAWLTAYKTAQYNDTKALTTDSTVVKLLKATITDAKFSAKTFPVAVVGAEAGRLPEITLAYDDNYTKATSLADAFKSASSWIGKTVTVALKKSGEEDVELTAKAAALDGTETTALYHWDATTKKVTMTDVAIKDAYDASLEGWRLTFTIEDKELAASAEITASSTVVTFKGLNVEPDGTEEKDAENYTATLSSTPVKATVDSFYPFKATLVDNDEDHDSGRNLEAVLYTIDGVPAPANGFDLDKGADVNDPSHNKGIDYQDHDVTDAHADADYFVISHSDVTDGAKIALSAVTTESVHFEATYDASNLSLVNIDDINGLDVDAGTTVMSAGADSYAYTEKDYSFSVSPKTGYKVDSVAVKIYDMEGARVVTNKTLTADNYGVYKVEKSQTTGKMMFTVTASPVTGDNVAVKKESTGATVRELKTGTAITTLDQTGIIYKGSAFDFSVTPSAAGKYIKEVSYTMTDAPDTDTGKAVLQKTDIDGTAYYKIANITGAVVLTVTEDNAAVVYKTVNPDAVITIGGTELKDDEIASVPKTTDDFSFTVTSKNGAEIKGVYLADLASGTTVTDSNKGSALTATAGTYKIGRTTLAGASNYLKVTVVTAREATGYSVSIDSNRTPAADNKDIQSLAMKAGYTDDLIAGSDATTKYTAVTLTPTITKSDNTKITVIGDGAVKWAWADSSKDKAIATITDDDTFATGLQTTKLAGANTLNFEYTLGFPNGISYKKTLPVTSTALSTVYSKLDFVNNVAQNKHNPAQATDDASDVDLTDDMKTVRLDESTIHIADSMTYGVMTYTKNDEGEDVAKGNGANYVIGATAGETSGNAGFVKSVTYEVAPNVESSRKVKPYVAAAANMGSGSNNGYKLSTFKDVDDFDITDGLTVSATVEFQDGSKTVVTDALNVQDQTYGYVAVPTVTLKGGEADRGNSSIDLETLSTGINSATVKYDVYKLNVAYSDLTGYLDDPDDVEDMLEAEEIENATGVYAAPTIEGNDDSEFATITGTSTLTITGKKKTPTSIYITPNITVDGMPVVVLNVNIDVDVYTKLPANVVTVTTKDDDGVLTGKLNPKMTSGLASITPISWIATAATKGSANEIYEGFILTSVNSGTKLTLPSVAAFDATTINPKRTLYGWKVNSSYYKADGTATVTIDGPTTITALWAYKYADEPDDAPAQGHVGLYSKIGDEYIPLAAATPSGAGTLAVAKGVEVQTYAGYYALDVAAGPDDSGDPQYATERTYDATGLTYSCTSETYGGVIEAPSAGKIKGKSTSGSVDLGVKWVDPRIAGNEFSTFGALTTATACIDVETLTVSSHEPAEYVASIKAISGLEATETRALALSVKQGDIDKTFGDFASVSVTSSNKNVATITEGTSFSDFMINAKSAGTTQLTFKVIDDMGVASNTATLDVTVGNSTVDIVAKVTNGAVENEIVTKGSEMQALVGDNTLKLSLADGTTTVDSDWTVTTSDPETTEGSDAVDVKAWSSNTTVSAGDVSINATALGIKNLTVTYTKTTGSGSSTVTHKYTREIPVRSYYAVVVNGPSTAQSTLFEVDDATGTAIAKDKTSVQKVLYADGTKGKTAYKYNASLKGYTAKQLDTTAGTFDLKGWSAINTEIKTDGSNKAYDIDEAISLNASDWASATSSGILGLRAVFGAQALTLSNVPTTVTLSDETLTTAAGAKGTDVAFIEVGVTPAKSDKQFNLTATDDGKIFLADGVATTFAKPSVGPGYLTASDTPWDGEALAGSITINKGQSVSTNRTDAFTIAKYNDTDKKYVGKTTITVTTPDASEYKKITVYLNGEYKYHASTGPTDPDVFHYMENGADIKAPAGSTVSRTVNGAAHYYDETGALVTDGVVDVDGKKILIVGGAQRTTVGPFSVNDIGYYIGTDGFVKTGGIFAGEAASDKSFSYYADETGALAKSEVVAVSGKNYFFGSDYRMAKAAATADKYALVSGTTYYVNADGEVAMNGIFKVEGVDRLFTEAGKIVTYADTTDGKITVGGVKYVIDKDTNAAKRDDIWYNPRVTWATKFPSKWDKKEAIPAMAYTVTYTSANEGKDITTDSIIATVTSNPSPIPSDATEVTFTATADLSAYFQDKAGTKKAENVTTSKSYKFSKGGEEGQSGQEVDPEGDITIEGLEDSYPWTGKQIKPTFSVYDSVAGKYLAKGVDYTVKYGKNKDAGEKAGSVKITGKGNYAKAGKEATFDIEKVTPDDPAGEVKSIGKLSAMEYNGSPLYPDTISVTLNDSSKTVVTMKHQGDGVYSNDAIGGKELAVSVTNNVDKGSATVAVWGAKNKNGKEVVKTATFKINAKSMEGANATGADGNPFEVTIDASADYRIKNTRPNVSIKFNGNELIEGQDYKVDVNVKKAKVTVTGKNNFTKKFEQSFTINKLSLAECEIAAATVYAGAKPSAVKLTILDPNRDIVPTKNYTLTVTPDSDALDSKGKLIEGKNVHVKATGKGDNVDSETYVEGDFTVAANLGKAKVTVPKALTKTYTGSAIELEDSDFGSNGITVTLNGKTLEKDTDFEVTGYQNNVKKGTMTVYITGKGDFSGTKNFKVKIVQKAFGK